MPVWLTITIAVVGLVGTVLGILGLTSYISERAKHKATKRNQKEDEAEQQMKKEQAELDLIRHEKYKEELRNIIKEENQSFQESIKSSLLEINVNIEQIRKDISVNTVGEVTLLRDRMKDVVDECNRKQFATTSDKANWSELYNSYKDLGGNHFKEYVDGWKKEMEDLPTKPSRKKKKEILTETIE